MPVHTPDRGKSRELQSLQALRAIAATSVVYYHIFSVQPDSASLVFGSFGVDIFFVISGFVMAMVIENGQSSFSFALARLKRIVPLYWILTTGLLILAFLDPGLLKSTTVNLINYLKSIFFIPYFKENGRMMPMLAVGWTLNYEMYFYFCLWFALLIYRKYYLALTVLMISCSFFLAKIVLQNDVMAYFLGSSYVFEFVIGLLMYKFYTANQQKSVSFILAIATAFFAYTFMAFAEINQIQTERVLIYGVPSAMVVYFVLSLEQRYAHLNRQVVKVITTVGNGSYATYLSHFYVIEGLRRFSAAHEDLFDIYSLFGMLFAISLSLAVGHAIYVWIDQPTAAYLRRKLA